MPASVRVSLSPVHSHSGTGSKQFNFFTLLEDMKKVSILWIHVNSSIQILLYYYASIYTSEHNFSLCITLYGRSLVLIIMDAHQPAIRQSHAVIRIRYWELPTNQGKKQNDIDTYYTATLCQASEDWKSLYAQRLARNGRQEYTSSCIHARKGNDTLNLSLLCSHTTSCKFLFLIYQ